MNIKTLYGVVLKSNNGGEKMNSFLTENSALNEAEKLVNLIKSSNKKGFKVYLSKLEYDEYENVILSDSLIGNKTKLIFEN
ncbi:hypothetical protein ACH95_22660 [Bacillus glycinifermentans]|uniref:Uncharacterized protein n=2 Tax=Bacillus sonorensis TaxID=119858 RepID=M5PAE9_9BACI|nr:MULTISPECIES: hypothetical protein [Bacillus]ASB89346.1 hypothetical protein S101395_02839 [Bacillus sonorensis]EME72300.1 hypothetical protein BSONL12_23420 [Bacillus sonorensis L12]KMM52248.1 hypothetical protein ACH95_22660 [Bacillus glycinifermentans]MCZ0075374.1 hypothetical protein [Bacillus sonorensis]MCZ0093029.1 hypothetical protein [Bacillus sonorensis]